MTLRIFIFVSMMALGAQALAKGSSGGGTKGPKGSTIWVAAGAGTNAVSAPHAEFDSDGDLFYDIGINFQLIGPIYVTAALQSNTSSGKLKYDYTNPISSNHYQDDEVPFSSKGGHLRAGLHLRLLNFSIFHLFAEAGGFASTTRFLYDVTQNTTITTTGTDYITEEKDVVGGGTYADAGFDLVIPKTLGVRFGFRAMKGGTVEVAAMKKQHLHFTNGYGYFSLMQEF